MQIIIHLKVDEKEIVRNRYNRIPYPALDTKCERTQFREQTIEQQEQKAKRTALSQQMASRLSKIKRTNIDNQNTQQQKRRLGTISNKLLSGLYRFYIVITLALGSAAVHKHENFTNLLYLENTQMMWTHGRHLQRN